MIDLSDNLIKKLVIKSNKEEVSYYIVKKKFEFHINRVLEDVIESYFFNRYTKNLPKFFIIILEYGLYDSQISIIKKRIASIFEEKGGILKDFYPIIYSNFDEIKIYSHNNHIVHTFNKRFKYTIIIVKKEMDDFINLNLFTKTSFIIKNIPIKINGKPKERMAFRTISLSEFDEDWEDSDWKAYFEETTLLTILWQEPNNNSKNGERILKGVKKISFNDNDLSSFEKTYNKLKETIQKKDISLLPTPNSFENQYLEVAPKGIKGDDAYNNFFKKDKTKVGLMLNKNFLYEKLKN